MADKKISALTAASTPLAGTEVLPIVQGGSTVKVSAANITAGRTIDVSGLNASFAPTSASDAAPVYIARTTGADFGVGDYYQAGSTNNAGYFGRRYLTTVGWCAAVTGSNAVVINTGNLGSEVERVRVDGSGNISAVTGNLVVGTAGKGIDFSANTHAAGMTSELLDWYEEGTWTGTLTAATPPTNPVTATGRYTRIGNQITVAIEFDNVDTSGASGAMEVTGLPFTATAAGYGPAMKSGIGTQVITAAVYGGLSKVTFSDAGTMTNTNIVAAAGVYLRFSVTYFV